MMTTAKEYTIPELTYGGSKHSGKVLVDRADYYASMAREAVLQKTNDTLVDLLARTLDYYTESCFPEDLLIEVKAALVAPPKLQPWVCALCDQQHMDGEVCVEAMARNGVEQ